MNYHEPVIFCFWWNCKFNKFVCFQQHIDNWIGNIYNKKFACQKAITQGIMQPTSEAWKQYLTLHAKFNHEKERIGYYEHEFANYETSKMALHYEWLNCKQDINVFLKL